MANSLGASVSLKDCKAICEDDGCASQSMIAGHLIAAFTSITLILAFAALVVSFVGVFLHIWLPLPAALYFLSFVTSIVAWIPFVVYRLGSVNNCQAQRGSMFCPKNARKCRFYGFGMMVVVTFIVLVGFVVCVAFDRAMKRQATAAAGAKGGAQSKTVEQQHAQQTPSSGHGQDLEAGDEPPRTHVDA